MSISFISNSEEIQYRDSVMVLVGRVLHALLFAKAPLLSFYRILLGNVYGEIEQAEALLRFPY